MDRDLARGVGTFSGGLRPARGKREDQEDWPRIHTNEHEEKNRNRGLSETGKRHEAREKGKEQERRSADNADGTEVKKRGHGLDYAYIGGRYDMNYVITEEELT